MNKHTKTLNFIHDRLVEHHGESENYDYMHALRGAIEFVENEERGAINCLEYGISDRLTGDKECSETKVSKVNNEYIKADYKKASEAVKAFEDGVGLYVAIDCSNYNEPDLVSYLSLADYNDINSVLIDGFSHLYHKVTKAEKDLAEVESLAVALHSAEASANPNITPDWNRVGSNFGKPGYLAMARYVINKYK